MSTYISAAYNPKTDKLEECLMVDDYFGRHNYGVLFKGDDRLYEPKDVKFSESKIEDFNF